MFCGYLIDDKETLISYSCRFIHCIAKIRTHWAETKPFEMVILDIITRLLENAAFVCIHVAGRFLKISRKCVGLEVDGFSHRLNGR